MEAAVSLPRPRGAGRRMGRVASGAFVLVAAAVLALGALSVAGYRMLAVLSGSMAPAIGVGDAVASRVSAPAHARVGDIVTFTDPTRGNALVTHRVVDLTSLGHRYAFVTRGDANEGVERWSVAADGRIGIVAFRVPALGYALEALGRPFVRTALMVAGALALGTLTIRRIWAA